MVGFLCLGGGIGTDFDACGAIDAVLTPVEIAFFWVHIPFVGTRIVGFACGDEIGVIVHGDSVCFTVLGA
jgi:hypothetical protein